MRTMFALFISSMLFAAVHLFAQPAEMTVVPEVRSSAEEQLNLAEHLRLEIQRASDPGAKAYAVARTISHLEVIPARWPANRDAVAAAYLLQADVLMEGGWLPNVPAVLARALDVIDRSEAARVYRRLGEALYRLNDHDGAGRAFAEATAPRHLARLSNHERSATLRAAGLYYELTKQWGKAASAYAAAVAPGNSALENAHCRLFAAKAYRNAGDRARSLQEVALARAEIVRTRSGNVRGADGGVLATLEEQLNAIERD